MKMNRTIWKPDTCRCVVAYEWDGDLDVQDRVHTVVEVLPCQEHVGDVALVGGSVESIQSHSKNFNKNNAIKKVSEALNDPEGKEAHLIAWRYDSGKLVLTLPEEHKKDKAKAEAVVSADVEVE